MTADPAAKADHAPAADGAADAMWLDDASGERSLVEGFGLDGYAITYADKDGRPMEAAQFFAGMAAGHEISVVKDSDARTAKVVLGATFDPSATPPESGVTIGQPLPPFSLRTLSGDTIDKAALLGRPTLLSFHFAECVPCIREIPMLNTFARDNDGFNLFAVTFDDVATSKSFVDAHALAWPVLPDAQSFIDGVGVKTYPTMVLVDAAGNVRAVEFGVGRLTDAAQLEAWATAAMKAAPED